MDAKRWAGLAGLAGAAVGAAWLALGRPSTAGPDRPRAAPAPILPGPDDRGFVARGHRPQDRKLPAPAAAGEDPAWAALRGEARAFAGSPVTFPRPDDEDPGPEREALRAFGERAARWAALQDRLMAEAGRHGPNEREVWVELAELRAGFAVELAGVPPPPGTPEGALEAHAERAQAEGAALEQAAREAVAAARALGGGDDPITARLDALAARLD